MKRPRGNGKSNVSTKTPLGTKPELFPIDKAAVSSFNEIKNRLERAISAFDNGGDVVLLIREFSDLLEQGCDEANYFLGCLYEDGGTEVAPNLSQALIYYKKAADDFGYLEAYLALARFFYYGKGVPRSFNEAFRFYSMVDNAKPNAIAKRMLGRMYLFGEGIPQNYDKADAFLSLAAKSGNVYAIRDYAHLQKLMGRPIRHLWLRLKAGAFAFVLAWMNPRDSRLREG